MSNCIERTDGDCEITHVCKVNFAEPEHNLAPESVLNKSAVYIDVEENRGNSITFSTEIYAQPTNQFSNRHILLDTCAGESVYKDRKLFHELVPAPKTMIINGVNPKGKPLIATYWGSTDFGMVYYNSECIANILSFGNVVNTCESVEYNNIKDCYIVLTSKNGYCYTFFRDAYSNIYFCDLDTMVTTNKTLLVTTVNDKKKKYSARQIKQADLAREYQRKLGYASPGQLIKMIGQGKLNNGKISAQDVVRALDIYGPDLGSLKGKTTSHRPQLEEEPEIINQQFESQTMYLDLMFVNGEPFIISVTNPLEYVLVTKLSKRDKWTLWSSLESQIAYIAKYGFKIKMVRVDGEGAINTDWFRSKLSLMGIILDITGAGEAVAVVERKIRQVKERFRAVSNTLPIKLSVATEAWLVKFAVNRINLVPTRNSVAYTSPSEKLQGRKINVEKQLKHGFGDYVHLPVDTVNNSNRPRTQGGIALMSSDNLEGSWYYMLLDDWSIVKRTKAISLPMTDEVIAHLNKEAAKRKINPDCNLAQPVFEQNNRILLDGEDDDYINDTNLNPASMIEPNILLDNDALIDYEIEQQIDDPENRMDEDPRVVENNYIVDQILNELNNDHDDFIEYDDIPIDNQNLLDDIFGIDSDNEESENPDSQEADIPVPNVENNFDEAPILRRSARNHQPGKWSKKLVGTYIPRYTQTQNTHTRTYGFNMTVTEGINKLGDKAVDSITLEMNQMLDRKVWKGININSLNPEQRQSIIPCKMFLKEKTLADGSFDKLKSRIVAGGHMQDRDIYDNGSSPTVSTTSVFIIAALAAKEGRSVATIDFPGAFLNSDMPLEGDHVVYMRLNKYLSNILISCDKSYKQYQNTNGTIVVQLLKALYGCVESAKLWYDKISNNLKNLKYKINPYDKCVFNRIEDNNSQTTLIIHVDDMMISACDEHHVDTVIKEIELLYPGLSKTRGKIFNYIGMTFNYETKNKLVINMNGFISDLLKECSDFLGVSKTPAKNTLFNVNENESNPLLNDDMSERFHSIVAKLLYASKRARWDLLTLIAFLTKRVMNPRRDDWEKLTRGIQYIRDTQTLGVTLEIHDPIQVIAYVDASYGVHKDKKSHTGCCITLGKGTISAKSSTQKLNTKSSTEAELVALSDAANQILFIRNFLISQGYPIGPAIIYQDNLSTIQLIKNGCSNSERTRHVDIRFFFLHDRQEKGDVILQYMRTEDMIADILTKPLQGESFMRLRDQLLNST